jgi:hypothetical protein
MFVRPQFPPSVSLEDFTTYIGALSSLIWVNRHEYWTNNMPKSISVRQKTNGSFKSVIINE